MSEILKALIDASERAANVARSCCNGCARESLLVAEKGEGEANARFDKDFKTIADVLAQESARYEIGLRCHELAMNLRGEECSEIGGIPIKLCESLEETTVLLSALVPREAAESMATAAHGDIKSVDYPNLDMDIDIGDLGVWIDPIDATAEFISGVRGEADDKHGLPCVTVLIGAYLRSTGEPVMGVINQPFYDGGKGRIIWGVSYKGINKWSECCDTSLDNRAILMSSAESPEVRDKFTASGWQVKSVPGAGHKLMKVILNEASAYIVSKGTTFRWDTCGPHAILKAQGGDLLSYDSHKPITYNDPVNIDTQLYANSGGIIAFTKEDICKEILKILT